MYKNFYGGCMVAFGMLVLAVGAGAETRNLSVRAGETVVLTQPHSWNSANCISLGASVVTLIKSPEKGQFSSVEAHYEIGDFGPGRQTFGQGNCYGLMISGTRLLYTADKEATGEDTLRFDLSIPRSGQPFLMDLIYTITIE